MKKILSILLVAALATPMFAEKQSPEEVANADYTAWLPAQGDFFVGFSVDPFANFIGKMFSSSGATPDNYTRGEHYDIGGQALLKAPVVSIMGGYMLTDKLGLKLNLGVIVDHTRTLYNVESDAAKFENPFSHELVQDEKIHGEYGGSFAAGIEYRVGQKRVQGVFGAGLVYAFQTSSTKYSYGNLITEMNQQPTVASELSSEVWNNMEPGVYANTRLINDAASPADAGGLLTDAIWHRVGLYTTVGVEWFVAPKVALGLNVNLDLLYKWSNNVCRQYEGYNILSGEVETFTDLRGLKNYNGVTFGTENIGANLYLNFFF
jgi:hypothetical protein